MGKIKWSSELVGPLPPPLEAKRVNQKPNHLLGRMMEISDIIKDTKDAEEVVPATSPFNSPI